MSSESAVPTTQKAWMVVRKGKPRDALVLQTDVPVPKPKKGEVLIRVRAAALNAIAWKFMGGLPNLLARRPHPAEFDLAGEIADANDTSFSNGDEVFACIPIPLQFSSHKGALAQYITLSADLVALKPAKLTWEEAAALPVTALTAVQTLRLGGYDPARVLDNAPAPTSADQESIFIMGGSTSVGISAIQLAKALSLRVVASASGRNETFVRGVGADAVLDYTAQPIVEQLLAEPPEPRFGMVLDAAGLSDTAVYVKSGTFVKKGGVYVTTGPTPGKDEGLLRVLARWMLTRMLPSFLGGVPTPWKLVQMASNKDDLNLLSTLADRGILRAYLDSTYEFGSALDAYDKIMTGRQTGKIVVKVD